MKRVKQILALTFALVMVMAFIPTSVMAATGVMRDITAAELVADMGMVNTNHARALDRIDYDYKVGYAPDPFPNDQYSKVQWITLWTDGVTSSVPAEFAEQDRFSSARASLNGFGEFYTVEKFTEVIKEFKNAGYKAVRLPVSWTYWSDSTTHKIDTEWMDLVESCVKIVLDNGLYCIINAHEDYMKQSWVGDHWDGDWMAAQYKDYVDTRYVAIWKQVSERFRDYGDYLIFESFNEPSDSKRDYKPYNEIVDNAYARINEMQALFVKTVRETGGNNAKRFLSLTTFMGLADHIERNQLDAIKLPNDKNIIVQAHYYFYGEDGNPVKSWNRKNSSDTKPIDQYFTRIEQFMDKTGVPVILGEFGNTEWLSERDRIDQATYILEKTKDLGIPLFWWDATMDSDWDHTGYSGSFSLYNRNIMAWEHPNILKAITAYNNNATVPTQSISTTAASQTTVGSATDRVFNAEASNFIKNADKAITWKRKALNGIEFIEAYRDDGTKKPLIFFLHGGGRSKEESMGALDMYAHEGFYAVALDVAGCGDSQVGPIMAYKAFEVTVGYIDSLVEYYKTAEQADADRFAVGGGSMGGTISFCYAAHGNYKPKVILPDLGTPDLLLNSDGPMFDCFDKGKSGQMRTMSDEELRAFAAEYSPIKKPESFTGVAIYARNGMNDNITPPTGCKNLESALKNLGHTDIVFNYYENAGHGDLPNDGGAGLRFLKDHMGMK